MLQIATRTRLRGRDRARGLVGFWVLAAALLLPVLPVSSWSQQITDEMLRKAAARTGLTKEQILELYRSGQYPELDQQSGSAPPDSSQAPGRTEIPDENNPAPSGPAGGSGAPGEAEPGMEAPGTETPAAGPLGTAPGGPEARTTTKGRGRAQKKPGATGRQPTTPLQPKLFGSDFFKLEPGVFTRSSFGPVPDDYVIGVGDQIVVDVWGDVEFRIERVVDRDGSIILPKGGKISCAGETLERVKRQIRSRLAEAYSGVDKGTTSLDVTLGSLRPIRVFVIGEAVQPGAYQLSSMATVFTALYAAGGPSPAGSMRDVRLIRGDQVLTHFDLYDYLLKGDRHNDLILREYDTVLIPPRGKTVQLRGEVHRPLLFELKEAEGLSDLLGFGGGFTATAATGILHIQRIVPPARRQPGEPDRVQVDVPLKPLEGDPPDGRPPYEPAVPSLSGLFDGDVVAVDSISTRVVNWVEIQGPVKQPGRYEYHDGMDVAELVDLAGKAWPELLTDRALIDRLRPDGTLESFHFSIGDVLAGRDDKVMLEPRDQVRLFSKWEVQDRDSVSISGSVRKPGTFAFREGMTLHDLVLKAAGLAESADSVEAHVSRLRRDAIQSRDEQHPPDKTWDVLRVPLGHEFLGASQGFLLEPHDAVVIRRLPWWEARKAVVLNGTVLYPGVYTLQRPQERISELIELAGGLKPDAFLAGARLNRAKDGMGNLSLDLACALKHPDSECNLILVEGDEITIPERPYTVKVIGAVGHPTSLIYEEGKKPGYYVGRSGGYAQSAAKWSTQVVYPNGMSRKIRKFWFDPPVVAGSTIIVPVEPPKEKGDQLETLGKISAILASLATVYLVSKR